MPRSHPLPIKWHGHQVVVPCHLVWETLFPTPSSMKPCLKSTLVKVFNTTKKDYTFCSKTPGFLIFLKSQLLSTYQHTTKARHSLFLKISGGSNVQPGLGTSLSFCLHSAQCGLGEWMPPADSRNGYQKLQLSF